MFVVKEIAGLEYKCQSLEEVRSLFPEWSETLPVSRWSHKQIGKWMARHSLIWNGPNVIAEVFRFVGKV